MSRALPILLLLLAAAPAVRSDEAPALAVVSRRGELPEVKVFDGDEILFFARGAGEVGADLLRGVRFVLYDEGGDPARAECVRRRQEDRVRWGSPPSSFRFPLEDRPLPVGRYRLRAEREGFLPGETKIVLARFRYRDLRAEWNADRYLAAFHLRLEDVTETRKAVPGEVRVETAAGVLRDSREVLLAPVPRREHAFATRAPVRLSSRLAAPGRDLRADHRTGPLAVAPGDRLVLVLDGNRFSHPIPLPPEPEAGEGGESDDLDANREKRDARGGVPTGDCPGQPGRRGR